jgi:glutamate 5-kinase
MRDEILRQSKRIVVKIGSSLVSSRQTGLQPEKIDQLADEIAALRSNGREVLIVSSGAIISGIKKLGLQEPAGQTSGCCRRPESTDVGL